MRIHPVAVYLLTALLSSSLMLTGCDSDEDDDEIPGMYRTTRFTLEIGNETVDILNAGGFIEMTLREDGTVSGRMFVPVELAEGEANDTPFAGTYAASGNRVQFDHEADTFIRDTEWLFDDGTLSAEMDAISVALQKQ